MAIVVAAVTVGVGAAIIGNTNQQAAKQQKDALKDAAQQEAEAYQKAQDVLGKSADQAVTDIEANNLKAQGILSKAEANAIQSLNSSSQGAIATLQNYQAMQTQGLNTDEGNIIAGLVNSGAIERSQLTGSYLQQVKALTGAKDEAFNFLTGGSPQAQQAINRGDSTPIDSVLQQHNQTSPAIIQQQKNDSIQAMGEAQAAAQKFARTGDPNDKVAADQAMQRYQQYSQNLDQSINKSQSQGVLPDQAVIQYANLAKQDINQFYSLAEKGYDPYTELGQRATQQAAYLGNLMTPQEKADYEAKFGTPQASPLFEFQKQQLEEVIQKQQMASGKVFSGEGLKQYVDKVVNGLSAAEVQRLQENANQQVQTGLAAQNQQSALQAQQGAGLANINQNTGTSLANLQAQRQQALADVALNTGTNLANAASQYGTQMAQSTSTQGSNIANTQTGFSGQRQNVLANTGNNISNLQANTGIGLSNIQTNSATQRSNIQSNTGANRANIGQTAASAQAGLIQNSAINQYNSATNQAQLNAQAQIAPVNAVLGAANTAATLYGYSQGMGGVPALSGATSQQPGLTSYHSPTVPTTASTTASSPISTAPYSYYRSPNNPNYAYQGGLA